MPADQAAAGLSIEGPRELRGLLRYSHEAMATVFEVYASHPDAGYAAQAARAAFDLADRLERELSRFLPNSDVSRVSALAGGERTRVGVDAMECLVIARHMFDLTAGAFDVSIGTGLASLELDTDRFEVHATRCGAQVDLGGIGKGYAVDLMAELLEEWGIEAALVHGGFSSVVALDPPAGLDGWPLTFSDPSRPSRVLASLFARRTAFAASGRRKGDHIVDPRTGHSAAGRLGAWVAVPSPHVAGADSGTGAWPRVAPAAVADALATAFLLMDVDEIEALCARSPGVEAWILPEPDADGGGETSARHFCGSRPGYTSASFQGAT